MVPRAVISRGCWPRPTAKSFLILPAFRKSAGLPLLHIATYLTLSREPGRIGSELTERDRILVIDEIQRLSDLFNEAHHLTETGGRVHFFLTGSRARKPRCWRSKLFFPIISGCNRMIGSPRKWDLVARP